MAEIEVIPATAPTPPPTPPPTTPPASPVPTPKNKKEKAKEIAKRVKWGLKNVGRILKGRPPRDRELQDMTKIKPGKKTEKDFKLDLLN